MNKENDFMVYRVTVSWNLLGHPLGRPSYKASVDLRLPCSTPQDVVYAKAVAVLFQRFAELGCLHDLLVRPCSIVTA